MQHFFFALLASILVPFAAAAQATPNYIAAGSGGLASGYLDGAHNIVYYSKLGPDSIVISSDPTDNRMASTYIRDSGEHFLRRVKAWGAPTYNYAFVFKNSIVIVQADSSFLYFCTSKQQADTFHFKSPRLRIWKDSLAAMIDSIETKKQIARNQSYANNVRTILSAFARNMVTSSPMDPTLVRDVKKWSGNPTTTVYIGDNAYYYKRNSYGTVLYKCIPVVYKYRIKDKCYIQYRMLGYEALNGGTFATDVKDFATANMFTARGAGTWMNMVPYTPYEIDCQ